MSFQSLFDLKIGRLRLDDGELLYNDTRTPLSAKGAQFQFAMDYGNDNGKPIYLGRTSWHDFTISAMRYMPFVSDASVHFTLRPDSFSVTQLQWKALHSEIDAQAELASFSQPAWTFRYRGQTRFDDFWSILRQKDVPGGHVEFTGDGRYDGKNVSADGRYSADQLSFKYQWFHPGDMSAHGSYHANEKAVDLPDLEALAIGGSVSSHVHLDIPKQLFTAETKVRGLELRQALATEDNPSLPINTLHWGSRMDIDATTTWVGDFQHVDSRGHSVWTPPATPVPGQIPTAAHFDFHYDMDRKVFELSPGEITTPSARIQFHGSLSMVDTSVDLAVDTDDLTPWDDFINRLRGTDRATGNYRRTLSLARTPDGPSRRPHFRGLREGNRSEVWRSVLG